MNFQRSKRRRNSPDITPLIDVMFFMLVFFMVFSTLKTEPMGLDVELPRAVTGTAQTSTSFEVVVDKSGAFYVSGRHVTGAELEQDLVQRLQVNPDIFVIVKADKEVRYEHVVRALDHIRGVGGYRLGLAVEQGT
ncbi:MAG: biopolymer transporter ExbD [Bacillota bacterium]|jgi:biopolymer transport protein ExbD|nr:biopolymer transporter ExbD [Bacillota bacterium]NLJ03909.1 biopolymer transporter ExbD [Bacillota bacterium]